MAMQPVYLVLIRYNKLYDCYMFSNSDMHIFKLQLSQRLFLAWITTNRTVKTMWFLIMLSVEFHVVICKYSDMFNTVHSTLYHHLLPGAMLASSGVMLIHRSLSLMFSISSVGDFLPCHLIRLVMTSFVLDFILFSSHLSFLLLN